MPTELNAQTDLNSLKERIGIGPDEELRNSHRRESYLQKFARLMSMDSSILLNFNQSKAAVELERDTPRILIPTQEYNQPVTDFNRKVYDLILQETLTLHEIGHILYSDAPSLKECRERLDEEWQPSFQLLWNAVEDGCIENQLRYEFNSENELTILNANLSEEAEFGHRNMDSDGNEEVVYTMIQAMVVSILDLGQYNSGCLEKLVDPDDSTHRLAVPRDEQLFQEFLPTIEQVVEDSLSEPNAEERNEIIYEFFLEAKEYLEKADVSGRKDQKARGDFAPMDGKPDDAHEGIGPAREDMNSTGGGSGFSEEEEREISGQSDPAGGLEDNEEVQESFEEELRQEIESIDGGEALIDELEKFHEMMKGAGPGEDNMELLVPDPEEPRPDIWQRANNMRRQLKTILRNRLNWHRDKREVRNRRRGQLDTNNMIRASRGDPRIFKQFKEGKEKDYSCILVQDRSGSMSSDTDDAEISVGAFSMALEDLGVDTMVLDFVSGRTRLAKPFGASPRTSKGTLTSGKCGGGTPLSDAVRLARERIGMGAGTNPFIIVITDGKAHSPDEYRKEIDKCSFPVMAIYLRSDLTWEGGFDIESVSSDMAMFHRHTIVTKDGSLPESLYQLATEMML